jgi:hypothetical protein
MDTKLRQQQSSQLRLRCFFVCIWKKNSKCGIRVLGDDTPKKRFQQGTKSTQVGQSIVETLARVLLRELVTNNSDSIPSGKAAL